MSLTLIFAATIAFLVFIGLMITLVVIGSILTGDDEITDRIHTFAISPDRDIISGRGQRRVRFLRLRLRINNALSVLVPRGLRMQLLSAHWPIYETEFVLIRLGVSALGLGTGWYFSQSIFPGIGLTIIAYLIPGFILRRSINRRRQRFQNQLIDVLVLINGGIRAGYSLLQSLDIVIEEMLPPATEEFRRVRREVELGLPLSQALGNLADRMQNDDLDILVAAININMQVGGNLTVMLQSVTQTIRERIRLFSEVRSITSGQIYTGYILTGLPFFLGGLLFILNPSYMARLFEPGWILCVPCGALIGILIGNLIIRQIVKIDV
jgi:tight adherence protein B